jgi:nucleoporin SEH1
LKYGKKKGSKKLLVMFNSEKKEEIIKEVVDSKHSYYVHEIKYDFYGKRIATCSSDLMIKIFDKVEGKWESTYEWKTHNGSIWKVEWANPEFGQIIASCSFDRTVMIWEVCLIL